MDFALTDEQQAIREAARRFAQDRFAPHAARWDEDKIFPEAELRAAAALGFASIYIREDQGGAGMGRLDAALAFEGLSAGCASTAAYISIHTMASWMIDRFGNDELRRRFLPQLARMELFASYCLTEPNAGSDAAALATRAQRDGEDYILTGSKAFISGGGRSDVYVVMARTGEAGPKGISCFLVEKDRPGLSFGQQERKMGWNSQPTAMVMLDACRIPAVNRIGHEGEGFKIAMAGLDGGRVNIAACSLGAASACLDAARRYASERHQFDQALQQFQSVQFKLADMATELDAARLMVWRAAWMMDQGHSEATLACAMAKRFATDVGFAVANEALQIHGGYGYLRDYPIERHVRDVRVHQILEGTNEIMRLIIARRLIAGASLDF